jgi:hypothetical protein
MGSSSLNRDFLFGSENVEHCTPALFSRRVLESSHLLEDPKAVIRVGRLVEAQFSTGGALSGAAHTKAIRPEVPRSVRQAKTADSAHANHD